MNITQFMREFNDTKITQKRIFEMVEMREKAAKGFLALEQEKGVYDEVNIHTPKGQDIVRLFLFRTIEEICESLLSTDEDHRLEELIDALNYLWAIPLILGVDIESFFGLLDVYLIASNSLPSGRTNRAMAMILQLAGEFPDTLRNRSWMNHAQDDIFSGWSELSKMVYTVTDLIIFSFPSFNSFLSYYYAKHDVLMFRLETKY